jgi:hypothetical protein
MASPVTIQPSTADTWLAVNFATTNYGAHNDVHLSATADATSNVLVSFNFSASVPAGATITLATLSLYAAVYASGRTIGCYRLRRTDWVEAQATWNIYKTGSNWGTAGALDTSTDHDTTDGATSASLSAAGWQNWTVTAQVQYARDNVAGIAHFFLRDTGAAADKTQRYSDKETVNTTLRPKLYIEYTEAAAGPAALQTVNGLAKASVATRNGLAIASIKTWNGLA